MDINKLSKTADEKTAHLFRRIDETAFQNHVKVQEAFAAEKIGAAHFNPTSGYGYDDEGRGALDNVYACVFGAQTALVRPNIISGTHAIATMFFAVCRPGDRLLSATGKPYDTLAGVIKGQNGSLEDFGVSYSEVPLNDGIPDYDMIKKELEKAPVKAVLIQRSRGYDLRPSLTIDNIKKLCTHIKSVQPNTFILVDNCYGEFTEIKEPTEVGADLMAGSLIKNPGGGLAPTGGYIAGKKELVALAADALTAPGIGSECGCNFGMIKQLFQGFYIAPHTVSQSMKTAVFCAALMQELGYEVYPEPGDARSCIIQAVLLKEYDKVVRFCRGIQAGSPVDSFVSPIPWAMPGYDSEIIMAAGAFTQGASIEISADAPMRPPYAVYVQGGLTYESGKYAVIKAAQNLLGE